MDLQNIQDQLNTEFSKEDTVGSCKITYSGWNKLVLFQMVIE